MTTLTADELSAISSEPAKATRGRKPTVKPMARKPVSSALAEDNRLEAGRAQGRETRKTEQRDERQPRRVPMYEQRRVLLDENVPDGYVGRWANATIPGRVESLQRAGYSFVTKDGKVYSHHVTENGIDSRVSKSGSDGVTLYLMIIPEDLYEEDQEAKHKMADEQSAAVLGKLRGSSDFYARDQRGHETGNVSHGVGVQTIDHPFE